ncbi:HAD family hydrolase [Vibrio sp. SCSIO 43135]|uniref:HAD family hydrolase n=1 Tax=Vibrio sp. SCSIO 43135 TaxID=2819096 RepID=UPI002074E391|nr:HAD family hydrolase [Vibrio sp. SCSIO 43135]USD43324.1 HAD family hydrolase [Vibrio sp. SCSIO 43135]
MKYQAVIIDLDGTLLNDDEQISATNREAIHYALEHGYKVTLASGRPHELMMPYVEQLNLTLPIICCNGAYIYNPMTNEAMHRQLMTPQLVSELLRMLNDGQFDFTLYASNGVFVQQPSAHSKGLVRKAQQIDTALDIHVEADLAKLAQQLGEVYKVLVSSEDKQALCDLRDAIQPHCQADLSAPTKLDITALSATKGSALTQWLTSQQISPNHTIAFGDGDNDASMFRIVGEPVAMDSASPSLKGMANLIVTDNNGCGIGQYLRLVVREGLHTCQHSFSY